MLKPLIHTALAMSTLALGLGGLTSTTAQAASHPTRCINSDMALSVRPLPGGGHAGGSGYRVMATNTSGSSCTLRGFPGVSMVWHDAGDQLGAPADRIGARGPLRIVAPRASVSATLEVTAAGTHDAGTCRPQTARGFRIYLPDETRAAYSALPVRGCASPGVHLMQVHSF